MLDKIVNLLNIFRRPFGKSNRNFLDRFQTACHVATFRTLVRISQSFGSSLKIFRISEFINRLEYNFARWRQCLCERNHISTTLRERCFRPSVIESEEAVPPQLLFILFDLLYMTTFLFFRFFCAQSCLLWCDFPIDFRIQGLKKLVVWQAIPRSFSDGPWRYFTIKFR